MTTFNDLNPIDEAKFLIFVLTLSTLFSSEALIYRQSQSILFTMILARVVLPVPATPYNNRCGTSSDSR
jgi:hypothetical protein